MRHKAAATFLLGTIRYCIMATDIYKIIEAGIPITQVPNAKPCLIGIMHFEGEIIPVISLAKFFSYEYIGSSPAGNILILSQGDIKLGLLVEAKIEFIDEPGPPPLEIIRMDDFINKSEGGFVTG